jgi:hypothetical protein
MNELWQEICFILHDISMTSSEELYEQKIIQSLEKLGWSRFRKEIILKQRFQLGSAGTIIPDIIVKSLDTNELFVIEVKRMSADIENTSHQNQLFSYMRQLRLQHGLLIGSKIQIYYDGDLNRTENPILLKSLDIIESNVEGSLFVHLFRKESFTYSQLNDFAEKTITQLESDSHKEKLRNLLLSRDYQKQIQQFITDNLRQNWDEDTIKTVLSELSVSIRLKDALPPNVDPVPSVQIKESMKIGQMVRESMKQVVAYCKNSEQELSNLKSETYSKTTFNINYSFLREVNSTDPKQERYWKDKYLINNKYYVVTSEWFKGSLHLFKAYLTKIE